jgi:hypothetical protein
MVNRNQLMTNIRAYLYSQINTISEGNPAINLFKPFLNRAIDNNLYKIEPMLDFIADKDGNIDIENIISEMRDSILTSQPFTVNLPVLGDVEIGNGLIMANIPMINKRLVLNRDDLNMLKEMLIIKS